MRIIIPGIPIAKARPKFCVRGQHAMAYDPQCEIVKAAKKDLLFRCDEYFRVNGHLISSFKASFSDQKKVFLAFHVPVASSDSKAQRNEKLWSPEFGQWHSKKDLDNYIKWILDIGNGILWNDDSQIVELHAFQEYSEKPCTILTVEDIKMIMNDDTEKMMRIFSPAALDELESKVACLLSELQGVRLCNRENRTQSLESAAMALKAFAMTYCDSLKKLIAKDNKKK